MAARSIQSNNRQSLRGRIIPILKLSWPTIFTFSILSSRGLIDVWLVGKLEMNDLAALAPAHLMLILVVSLGFGGLYAVNSFVAHEAGAGRLNDCGHYVWQGIWLAILYGAIVGIAGYFGSGIFWAFGHEPAVAAREIAYFRIAVLSVLPQLVAFAAVNFFFGIGRSVIPMLMAILGVMGHGLVGYALVLGNFGFPKFGIAGAGWALLFASLSQAVFMILWLTIDPRLRRFGQYRIRPSLSRIRKLCRVGAPVGARDLLDHAVFGLAFIWLVGQLGPLHLAAASVMLACIDVLLLPCDGLGAALVTLVGRSVGRRRFDEAESWRRNGWMLMTLYATVAGLGFYFLRPAIFSFLVTDAEVYQLSADLAFFVTILVLLYAWNSAIDHALCGAGDNLWATVAIVITTMVILGGGGMLFVVFFVETGSYGVWTLLTVNVAVIVVILALRWKSGAWKKGRLLE